MCLRPRNYGIRDIRVYCLKRIGVKLKDNFLKIVSLCLPFPYMSPPFQDKVILSYQCDCVGTLSTILVALVVH